MRAWSFTRPVFGAVAGVVAVIGIPDIAFGQMPAAQAVVGTPACPKLNAHDRKACRFTLGGHDFQVWPGRIAVEATPNPEVWLVTSDGNSDGMFDHTLARRKDDHVTFQCFVRKDGTYYGPAGFRITRGGTWATYGEGIVTASAVASGAIAAYFTGGAGGPAAAAAGGGAAQALGDALSRKHGKKGWEVQAGKVATAICRALAR